MVAATFPEFLSNPRRIAAVSVLVRCECGKENRVDAGLGAAEVSCIRCSRALTVPAARPAAAAADPYGLMTPDAADGPRPAERHPAAALEEADPVPHPAHPRRVPDLPPP